MAFYEDARDRELIRLLEHLLQEMNTKSARLPASALQRDIKQAKALIGQLQYRDLNAELDLRIARN